MARVLFAFAIFVVSSIGAAAQDRVFLQIAARPTLDQALQDLRGLSRELTGLGG